MLFGPNKCEELVPCAWVISEHAYHGAGKRPVLELAHATHGHTHVPARDGGRRERGREEIIYLYSGNATIRVDHRLHVYYTTCGTSPHCRGSLIVLSVSAYTQPHDQVLQKNNSFLWSYVRCLHYDSHTSWVDGSQHSVRYLLSEPLLNCKRHTVRETYIQYNYSLIVAQTPSGPSPCSLLLYISTILRM